jgi:hypothetical protein
MNSQQILLLNSLISNRMKPNIKTVEKDISTPFFKYRDCCRHIWNSYFMTLSDSDDKYPDILKSFQIVKESLFHAMIADHLYHRWLVKTIDGYYNEITVKPGMGPTGLHALWVKPGPERRNYVWQAVQLISLANDFRFIDFFDWTFKPGMECQYVKARLIASDELPELVGNDFLLEASGVKYFRSARKIRANMPLRCAAEKQDSKVFTGLA